MFTGLVETVGTVCQLDQSDGSITFSISAPSILSDVSLGDSICVNGVCLTVVGFDATQFTVQAVPETLRRTNLGLLAVGSKVNCERSMSANSRFGGHVVQGHVDTTLDVLGIKPEGDAVNITFSLTDKMKAFVVEKGYVTIDGTSLTVVHVDDASFSVTVIPHTFSHTISSQYEMGTRINFEADMMAKYVAKYMEVTHESATR